MDSLALNFDALQRLSEALPKKGASLSLAEIRSLFKAVKGLANTIEAAVSKVDRGISFIRANWTSLSDEEIESLKLNIELAQKSLAELEENDLSIRLVLLIPSMRRRKNLYKLLRQSNERLLSTMSTAVSAWEAEREREFEEAASYVLEKNAELYRRLA